LKITHSSGRIETFAQSAQPADTHKNDQVAMSASPADHHNKIAILPFAFLMDRQAGAAEVGIKAQEDTFAFLSKHTADYTILDVRSTNAALIKAGVTRDKIMGFTMKEISDILGVEYIIDGTITQNKGYATSSSYGNTNTDIKRRGNDREKVNSSDYSNNNSIQRYDVSVSLNIYMDNNASIYNQTHKAFLTNTDGSYSSPLEYLLKRCPLYRN
jgi:TolB-like protein